MVHLSRRQESFNINVKYKKCIRCFSCICACSCAFRGQLPVCSAWLRSAAWALLAFHGVGYIRITNNTCRAVFFNNKKPTVLHFLCWHSSSVFWTYYLLSSLLRSTDESQFLIRSTETCQSSSSRGFKIFSRMFAASNCLIFSTVYFKSINRKNEIYIWFFVVLFTKRAGH